jgi:hypothetical protein
MIINLLIFFNFILKNLLDLKSSMIVQFMVFTQILKFEHFLFQNII